MSQLAPALVAQVSDLCELAQVRDLCHHKKSKLSHYPEFRSMFARQFRFPSAAYFLLAAALASGCGGGTVTLSGNVSVKGKPLNSGAVMVQSPAGEVRVGIVTDGNYSVEGVGRGVCKIAVTDGVGPAPADAERASKNSRAPIDPNKKSSAPAVSTTSIPSEYSDLDRTPLTHDTNTTRTKNIEIP